MPRTKGPPPVHEHDIEGSEGSDGPISNRSCPFCTIISTFTPVNPLQRDFSNKNDTWNPQKLTPPSYVLLATEYVVAFLDIAPLTRGHVLVSPRRHRVKVGDLTPEEMSEVGKLLPVIARSVIRAVLPDIPHRDADYNIVQNNGPGAAQVVPHVHFHIIPRPPLNYQPVLPQHSGDKLPATVQEVPQHSERRRSSQMKTSTDHKIDAPPSQPTPKYPLAKIPTGLQKSYVQFGRGFRHELDESDAESLVEEMRRCLREEWLKAFGEHPAAADGRNIKQLTEAGRRKTSVKL